jgi:hypothetical protein
VDADARRRYRLFARSAGDAVEAARKPPERTLPWPAGLVEVRLMLTPRNKAARVTELRTDVGVLETCTRQAFQEKVGAEVRLKVQFDRAGAVMRK